MFSVKSCRVAAFLALFAGAVAALPGGDAAFAHDFKEGVIEVKHPIVRVNVGKRPSAAYFTLENSGDQDDRLIGASSPAFERLELHNHVMKDGAMSMVRLDAIDLPAGGSAVFEQGGLHVMMFNPTPALGDAGLIPMTLEFEKAGSVEITAMGEMVGSMTHSGMKMSD